MTVNWTQEPARAEQPPHPHNTLAWTLWIISALGIAVWVAAMALGIWFGGFIHLILAAVAVLTIIHVILGFRNVEYFVPLRATGRLFGWGGSGSRDLRRSDVPKTLQPDAPEPVNPDDKVIPGNDPVSGPGQRRPDPVEDRHDRPVL